MVVDMVLESTVTKITLDKKCTQKITRRESLKMMCPSNASHIEQASQQHKGIADVAHRLTQYIGVNLPYGESNLLDFILSDALTSWDSMYESHGARSAYSAYCLTVKELLPLVFNYRVRSKKRLMPYDASIWNCISQTVPEWLSECQLNDVEIELAPVKSTFTQSDMSLLVSHMVFSRIDMMQWGLPPEGAFSLTNGEHSEIGS